MFTVFLDSRWKHAGMTNAGASHKMTLLILKQYRLGAQPLWKIQGFAKEKCVLLPQHQTAPMSG